MPPTLIIGLVLSAIICGMLLDIFVKIMKASLIGSVLAFPLAIVVFVVGVVIMLRLSP